MKKFLTLLAAAALLLLPSCRFVRVSDDFKAQLKEAGVDFVGSPDGERITPSNVLDTRELPAGEFSTLLCNLPCDLVFTPGESYLSISGPDNVLDHIIVSNEDGTLTIKGDGSHFRNLKNLKVKLSSPTLDNLTFNGAVDFQAPQGIEATDLSVVVNGAGDITIDGLKAAKASLVVNGAGDATLSAIECEDLSVSINGAGDATVSGHAAKASLSISGAGDIDASGLKSEEFNSKVRGVGKISKPKN